MRYFRVAWYLLVFVSVLFLRVIIWFCLYRLAIVYFAARVKLITRMRNKLLFYLNIAVHFVSFVFFKQCSLNHYY